MIEIKVPAIGESISEVTLLKWTKKDGDYVERDEVIAEFESEKATFEVNAEQAGVLTTLGKEGDTLLTLKELTPVRLLRNPFFDQLMAAYQDGASAAALAELLGRGRAKKGMFEGDLQSGELEIGQVAGALDDILPAATIFENFIREYNQALALQQPLPL